MLLMKEKLCVPPYFNPPVYDENASLYAQIIMHNYGVLTILFAGPKHVYMHSVLQTLGKVTSSIPNVDTSNATTEANTPKNRYQDKIPCNEIVCLLC